MTRIVMKVIRDLVTRGVTLHSRIIRGIRNKDTPC
jgi:hypothetical protein